MKKKAAVEAAAAVAPLTPAEKREAECHELNREIYGALLAAVPLEVLEGPDQREILLEGLARSKQDEEFLFRLEKKLVIPGSGPDTLTADEVEEVDFLAMRLRGEDVLAGSMCAVSLG